MDHIFSYLETGIDKVRTPVDQESLTRWAFGLLSTAVLWLVRTVMTNNKKVTLQENELAHHREMLARIEKQMERSLDKQDKMISQIRDKMDGC